MSTPALESLIAAYHARTPPRTWSLLVTIFGEVALERDQVISASEIGGWTGDLGIEPGLVRTALSRLVANGTLTRTRQGRSAQYCLSTGVGAEFRAAADIIYARALPQPTGRVVLTLIEQCPDRAEAKALLLKAGARALGATVLVCPEHAGREVLRPEGALVFKAEPDEALREKVHLLWLLDELDGAYRSFTAKADAMGLEAGSMTPHARFLARILLVHEFRRIVLRDPFLPSLLLPEGWNGAAARASFTATYAVLAG